MKKLFLPLLAFLFIGMNVFATETVPAPVKETKSNSDKVQDALAELQTRKGGKNRIELYSCRDQGGSQKTRRNRFCGAVDR